MILKKFLSQQRRFFSSNVESSAKKVPPLVDALKEGFPRILLPATLDVWSGTVKDLEKLILFEDKHLYVVFKPPTILSSGQVDGKAPKPVDDIDNSDMLDLLRRYRGRQLGLPHGQKGFVECVHRIDRPCSGLLVYAKTAQAVTAIGFMLNPRNGKLSKRFTKNYFAVAEGKCDDTTNSQMQKEGIFLDFCSTKHQEKLHITNLSTMKDKEKKEKLVNLQNRLLVDPTKKFLLYHEDTREELKKISSDLKIARLDYNLLLSTNIHESQKDVETKELLPEKHLSFFDVSIDTGRKHQIRAQFSFRGFPLYGDMKYHSKNYSPWQNIYLHEYSLSFPHPIWQKEYLTFCVEPPRLWFEQFPARVTKILKTVIDEQGEKMKKFDAVERMNQRKELIPGRSHKKQPSQQHQQQEKRPPAKKRDGGGNSRIKK
jgi:23S rRNA pseudouridine1911/1915/1917 synthase